MAWKDDWKERINSMTFRLKIFLWFLLTEPWRRLKEILHAINLIITSLNNALIWVYIFLLLSILSFIYGNNWAASIFLITLFLLIIMWEWQRGYFMYKYREEVKKKVKDKIKKEHEEETQKKW